MASEGRKMKLLKGKSLIVAMLCGLVLASVMIALGFSHNSQSEFFLPGGGIDLKFSLGLFGVWFVIGAILALLTQIVFQFILNALARKNISESK
jgi:hypothetical protein